MFIQREIWSFYTSVSHRVINLRTQSLLKETLNAVHLRELSAWWKSEHKTCRVEKIIIISLRLLRKALEKATPRGIRSLSTSRTHTSPTTDPSASLFSLWISPLSLPPGENVPYFWARRRFKFPAWAVVGNLKLRKALFPKLIRFSWYAICFNPWGNCRFC